jgi:hypothetical protein
MRAPSFYAIKQTFKIFVKIPWYKGENYIDKYKAKRRRVFEEAPT